MRFWRLTGGGISLGTWPGVTAAEARERLVESARWATAVEIVEPPTAVHPRAAEWRAYLAAEIAEMETRAAEVAAETWIGDIGGVEHEMDWPASVETIADAAEFAAVCRAALDGTGHCIHVRYGALVLATDVDGEMDDGTESIEEIHDREYHEGRDA